MKRARARAWDPPYAHGLRLPCISDSHPFGRSNSHTIAVEDRQKCRSVIPLCKTSPRPSFSDLTDESTLAILLNMCYYPCPKPLLQFRSILGACLAGMFQGSARSPHIGIDDDGRALKDMLARGVYAHLTPLLTRPSARLSSDISTCAATPRPTLAASPSLSNTSTSIAHRHNEYTSLAPSPSSEGGFSHSNITKWTSPKHRGQTRPSCSSVQPELAQI
jgi:hypothetical protein